MKYANVVLVVGGRYALQLRDEGIKVFPGYWGLFGGRIEKGETPAQAARREVVEELELEIEPLPLIKDIDGRWAMFWADVTAQWPQHRLHEGQRAGLFTVIEAAELSPISPLTLVAIGAHQRAARA